MTVSLNYTICPKLYDSSRAATRRDGAIMRDFERSLKSELPVLFRVAKRLSRSNEMAEDLVGQTLLAAVKFQSSFDGRHFRSWLIKILRNEFNSLIRRELARPTVVLEDAEGETEDFWEEVNWRVDADTLMRELDQLSEEHRMIIQLCDVEELTYEEASDALDIPIGTVRSRLFRARARLRARCLGQIQIEEGIR
jgi:RNA polymerase sigma-70 factor (ECF subfamily)